jgi:FkbM family methyltransferase
MERKKYPRFFINLIKAAAYKVYQLGQKATAPPLDKYDFQTFDMLKKVLPADANCIDVGAHTADILKKLIKTAPHGKHFAFEPLPWLYKDLQKKYGKKAQVFKLALSDKQGDATFYAFRERPAVSGLKQRAFQGQNYVPEQIKVTVETLDHVIPENLPIHLIKIDVEGAELQVLQGADNILKKYKPIVLFEFGLGGSDLYDSTPQKMYDYLQECGLSISILEYYLQEQPPLSRDEFIGQYEKKYNYFFIAYNASR